MPKNDAAVINNSKLGPKTKTPHLETLNASQYQDDYLTLTTDTSQVSDNVYENQKYILQNAAGNNENSTIVSLHNNSELSPKTGWIKRGFDNQAFSNDDEKKHSVSSQNKLTQAGVHKTLHADYNVAKPQQVISGRSLGRSESLEDNGNLNKDSLSIQAEQSEEDKVRIKSENKKNNRKTELENNTNAVDTSKETDDIAVMETTVDEDEYLEAEPPDMYYALARSSIDLRGKVLKVHKVSKIRKAFIMLSCFFMQVCLGLLFSLGILYVELLKTFGTDRSLTSLVQSLPLGLAYILGLIVGPLIQKLGLRVSIFCGGLLTATGFIASSFMNNIYAIIVLVGGVTGTGVSLFNIGTYASIPVYFGKKQRIAVAFTSFGTGTGSMLWPLICRALLKNFGWRGNLLITGGIVLNVCSLSLFFKPLPVQQEKEESDNVKKSKLTMQQKFVRLMKIPRFVALVLWCMVDGFASPVVGQMIVDFSRMNGYGEDRGATLLIYYSMFNAIGRAVVGIISRFNIPTIFIFATTSILCGTFYAILGYTNVYWETQVVIMASGFMLGAHVALNMIVLLKIVGPDLYGLGWGLAATGLGIGFTTSGPIAGYISELSSYKSSFFVAGLAMIADMTFYCTVTIICICLKKKSVTLNPTKKKVFSYKTA